MTMTPVAGDSPLFSSVHDNPELFLRVEPQRDFRPDDGQAPRSRTRLGRTLAEPDGGDELKSITTSAIGKVKAVLDAPAKKNEHISAEIKKLEAETAKLYAEAQKTNAESASIWADVYQKRLGMLGQLREMAVQLERDDVMDVLDFSFGEADEVSSLPAPKKKQSHRKSWANLAITFCDGKMMLIG